MLKNRAWLYRIPLTILCFFGLLYLIVHTPLRQYLPGYLGPNERALMEDYSMRIDSLEEASRMRTQYLEHLVSVLSSTEGQELLPFDTVVTQIQDTLMVASEREAAFVKKYEDQEQHFSIGGSNSEQAGRHPLFISPVKGDVLMQGDDADKLGVDISVSRETPVLSPLEGTVVSVNLIAGNGYDIIIQHAGDYLTVLSGLSMAIAEPRQQVKAGRVVGHAGGNSPSAHNFINIQVWYKGVALDPLSVMNFN